jgi:hypothetical protein
MGLKRRNYCSLQSWLEGHTQGNKRHFTVILKSIFDTAKSYLRNKNDDGLLLLLSSVHSSNIRLFII